MYSRSRAGRLPYRRGWAVHAAIRLRRYSILIRQPGLRTVVAALTIAILLVLSANHALANEGRVSMSRAADGRSQLPAHLKALCHTSVRAKLRIGVAAAGLALLNLVTHEIPHLAPRSPQTIIVDGSLAATGPDAGGQLDWYIHPARPLRRPLPANGRQRRTRSRREVPALRRPPPPRPQL